MGTHTLDVPTGPVAWTDHNLHDPAWMRVTLSEMPAPTPLTFGGEDYGDGRGSDTPYLLGETEDYLWTDPQTPEALFKGADVATRVRGTAEGYPTCQTSPPPTCDTEYTDVTFVVAYGNRGDQTATATRIVLATDRPLGTIEDSKIMTSPAIPTDRISTIPCATAGSKPEGSSAAATEDVCGYQLEVGDLAPQQRGSVILSYKKCIYPLCGGYFVDSLSATIQSSDDTVASNNTSEWRFNIGMPPTIVGPGNVTTSQNTFSLHGYAMAHALLKIFADGFESGDVSVGADGRWSLPLTLTDGPHTISVVSQPADGVQGRSTAESETSQSVSVIVDSAAGWDPASFSFESGGRRVRPSDIKGRTDLEGWRVPLRPGETYSVSVKVACATPAQVSLSVWDDTDVVHVVELTDPDGDGVFRGSFKATDEELQAIVSLDVSCGTSQTSYMGETEKNVGGVVVDAKTGQPIAGATVTVQHVVSEPNDEPLWARWPAEEYGQVNPQTTGEDGRFYVAVSLANTYYRLSITADGYQPWRSGPRRLIGVFPSRSIALVPVPTDPAGPSVALTEDGFDPPVVSVQPGDVVEWQNLGLGEHSATGFAPATSLGAVANSEWDSGRLRTGETFRLRMDAPGMYTYVDSENPANQAVIIVEAANAVHLPLIVVAGEG